MLHLVLLMVSVVVSASEPRLQRERQTALTLKMRDVHLQGLEHIKAVHMKSHLELHRNILRKIRQSDARHESRELSARWTGMNGFTLLNIAKIRASDRLVQGILKEQKLKAEARKRNMQVLERKRAAGQTSFTLEELSASGKIWKPRKKDFRASSDIVVDSEVQNNVDGHVDYFGTGSKMRTFFPFTTTLWKEAEKAYRHRWDGMVFSGITLTPEQKTRLMAMQQRQAKGILVEYVRRQGKATSPQRMILRTVHNPMKYPQAFRVFSDVTLDSNEKKRLTEVKQLLVPGEWIVPRRRFGRKKVVFHIVQAPRAWVNWQLHRIRFSERVLHLAEETFGKDKGSPIDFEGIIDMFYTTWRCVNTQHAGSLSILVNKDQIPMLACVHEAVLQGRSKCEGKGAACMQKVDADQRLQLAFMSLVRSKVMASNVTRINLDSSLAVDLYDYERYDQDLKMVGYLFGSNQAAQPELPNAGWYAAVAVFGLLLLVSGATVVGGFLAGSWRGRTPFLALVLLLVLATAMQTALWTIHAQGYQRLGKSPQVLAVEEVAVAMLERLGDVTFLVLLGLFVWLLADVALESMLETDRKAPRVALLVVISVLATGAAVYGLVKAALTTQIDRVQYFDASDILIGAVAVIFSAALAVLLVLLWNHVRKLEVHNGTELRTTAALMMGASLFFTAAFIARLVLVLVWLFGDGQVVEYPQGMLRVPLWIYTGVLYTLISVAVLAYSLTPVLAGLRAKRQGNAAGYMELSDASSSSTYASDVAS